MGDSTSEEINRGNTDMAKQVYEVNGMEVNSLKEVASILGVAKVSQKDLLEGGAYAGQVNLKDLSEGVAVDLETKEETECSAEGITVDTAAAKSSTEEECGAPPAIEACGPSDVPTVGDSPLEIPTVGEEAKSVNTEESLTLEEAKESFPKFDALEDLKAFIKDIDTPTLEFMATSLGCTWDHTNHPSIERMRIAQALHRAYFPDLFKKSDKKKSKKAKYGDYSTKQLFSMALEHGMKIPKSGHEPIDRMRAIMALKDKGYLPA